MKNNEDGKKSPRKELTEKILGEPGSADLEVAEAHRELGPDYGAPMGRAVLDASVGTLEAGRKLHVLGFPIKVEHTVPKGGNLPESRGLRNEVAELRREEDYTIDPSRTDLFPIREP